MVAVVASREFMPDIVHADEDVADAHAVDEHVVVVGFSASCEQRRERPFSPVGLNVQSGHVSHDVREGGRRGDDTADVTLVRRPRQSVRRADLVRGRARGRGPQRAPRSERRAQGGADERGRDGESAEAWL